MPYALVAYFLSRRLALYAYPVVAFLQGDRCPDGTVHLVRHGLAHLPAVDIQCQVRRVGVCLYVHHCRVALCISARGDIRHRFLVPLCLVEVEGVFLRLAVVCQHTLFVEAVALSLHTLVTLYVGKKPHELAPQVRPFGEHLPVAFMAVCLRLFGMEARVGA